MQFALILGEPPQVSFTILVPFHVIHKVDSVFIHDEGWRLMMTDLGIDVLGGGWAWVGGVAGIVERGGVGWR